MRNILPSYRGPCAEENEAITEDPQSSCSGSWPRIPSPHEVLAKKIPSFCSVSQPVKYAVLDSTCTEEALKGSASSTQAAGLHASLEGNTGPRTTFVHNLHCKEHYFLPPA